MKVDFLLYMYYKSDQSFTCLTQLPLSYPLFTLLYNINIKIF